MTTEQMIEEALKELKSKFYYSDGTLHIGGERLKDMEAFLRNKLTTIATKSAEEEQKRLVKVVENMGFDVENTTGYEDEDLWNLIEQEKVVKELSQPKGHQ